ncbi:MAG: glucosamine-6-phosphate deaminase [Planctomycetota bacterium]
MTSSETGEVRAARDEEQVTRPTVVVHRDASEACAAISRSIAEAVALRERAVLGLATGSTMVGVYTEVVRLVGAKELDLSDVTTFNLDEYLGVDRDDPRSFRTFMREQLFEPGHVDPTRAHFPDAELAASDPLGAARAYEGMIRESGGIDLQLLGLGRNGHVAFNEPPADPASRTRVVSLAATTREDAASTFGSIDDVPREAITMGVRTILEARRIRVLALGERKADVVRRALEGPVSPEVPASHLREHADVVFHLDAAAASLLGSD